MHTRLTNYDTQRLVNASDGKRLLIMKVIDEGVAYCPVGSNVRPQYQELIDEGFVELIQATDKMMTFSITEKGAEYVETMLALDAL